MTVNELLQKLVELARDGRGQWAIAIEQCGVVERHSDSIWDLVVDENKELVTIV